MENEKKQINENAFKEGDFSFPFKKMAERMKSCCPGKRKMADCCSMMKKMMQGCEEEESIKKKKEN
jgi:hypothetical protein